jgi:dihydroorotase
MIPVRHNGSRSDILIESGFIKTFNPLLRQKRIRHYGNEIHVSPGWVDVFANFADPDRSIKKLFNRVHRRRAGGFTMFL